MKISEFLASLLPLLLFHVVLSRNVESSTHSFTIDYENDRFLKDGVPFQYMSGSIHYSRVPYYYWKDRLLKMAAAGLDAAQFYVPWNIHEPQPGVYDFSGQQNLSAFLQTIQDAGLVAILRAGPYVCGEWEYGGLPGWLLSDNVTMVVRKMDKKYIAAVDRWMSVLLTYVKPYLYSNGGPIVMIQVENEYGSYHSVECGHDYIAHLRDVFRQHVGPDVILFTTDGNDYGLLQCGATDNVYATVDFGPTSDMKGAFDAMRKWNPKGPLVNSELYTGWLDYWGGGHAHCDTAALITTLKAIRAYNASVSMYMFEGGTNFAYWNGGDPEFAICPTSYDYDAPLTEAGDITDKYLAIRNFTSTYKTLPPVPPNIAKYAYGKVTMKVVGSVAELLNVLAVEQPVDSIYPLNMEQSGQYYGFVLYRHVFDRDYMTGTLSIPGIRDRGYVLIDGEPRGMVDRTGATSINTYGLNGQALYIVVENQGRLNYGPQINDNKKGLISNVTFRGQVLSPWSMYPLNISNVFQVLDEETFNFRSSVNEAPFVRPYLPTVFAGEFVLPTATPHDTYLSMCGWFKGQAFINGFNVGRYWPVAGPQVTLYVPAGVLNAPPNNNIVVFFELESSPSSRDMTAVDTIEFVDKPQINSRCFNPAQNHEHHKNRFNPPTVMNSDRL